MSLVGTCESSTASPHRYLSLPHYGISFIPVDVATIAACAVIALLSERYLSESQVGFDPMRWGAIGFVPILFVALGRGFGVYASSSIDNVADHLRRLACTWCVVLVALAPLASSTAGFAPIHNFLLHFLGAALVGTVGGRLLYARLRAMPESAEIFQRRAVCLLGPDDRIAAPRLRRQLARAGYVVSTAVSWEAVAEGAPAAPATRAVQQAIAVSRGSPIEEILVAADPVVWAQIASPLQAQPLPVRLVLSGDLERVLRAPVRALADVALLELQGGTLTDGQVRRKRRLDVVLAGVLLFLIVPLLTVVALLIRVDSRGPVIFRQTRRGFNGRDFKIYKFRTMSVREDGGEVRQAVRHDPRVTRVGRLLRRTSIDELPQLINVLRGEMSMVGPRPHAVAHDAHYQDLIADYTWRHHVKPGLTGWAQVHGLRGEIRTAADMTRRVEHDVWYARNYSIALDIKIMAMTAFKLFDARNAY